jgi:hypothetical protein
VETVLYLHRFGAPLREDRDGGWMARRVAEDLADAKQNQREPSDALKRVAELLKESRQGFATSLIPLTALSPATTQLGTSGHVTQGLFALLGQQGSRLELERQVAASRTCAYFRRMPI